jgi:hypothetical protein
VVTALGMILKSNCRLVINGTLQQEKAGIELIEIQIGGK